MNGELKTIAVPKVLHEELKRLAEEKSRELGGIKIPIYLVIREALEQYLIESRNRNTKRIETEKNHEFCKTCGAPLPSPDLDYCPDNFSCGNHLHLQGRPHDSKFCAFCSFPEEVEFAKQMRKEGWDWERIRKHLEATNTFDQVAGIVQASMLERDETE